jgi:hypothetical protein
MINCRNCINWSDESLDQIEADKNAHPHIFMGCRIFGYLENNEELPSCKYYRESDNLFAICSSCHITIPKVCISLGECINCTDTDLFCLEHCKGGEGRKYCTHFVRLQTDGMQLIDEGSVYDIYPRLGMPGKEKKNYSAQPSEKKKDQDG